MRVIELLPALDLFLAQPVDGHVGHDPVKPGIKTRLEPEPVNGFPRLEKTHPGQDPTRLARYGPGGRSWQKPGCGI